MNYRLQSLDDEELDELDDDQNNVGTSSRELDIDCLNLDDDEFDDIDRISDPNQLMENTMLLIANATEL